MNKIGEIGRLNQQELDNNIPFEASWHQTYKNCPWIFFGGVSLDLSEGDIICMFSQWGEVEDINLVRDHDTGKSKGFGFLRYENWLSCVLAVDNFNGMDLLGRLICVDHKKDYRPPKEKGNDEEKEPEKPKLERSRSRSHHNHSHHRRHNRHRNHSHSMENEQQETAKSIKEELVRRRSFSSDDEKPVSIRKRSFSDSFVCYILLMY